MSYSYSETIECFVRMKSGDIIYFSGRIVAQDADCGKFVRLYYANREDFCHAKGTTDELWDHLSYVVGKPAPKARDEGEEHE